MEVVLLLSMILLALGSVSVLVVALSNPELRGMGYLCSSFALGSAGMGVLLFPASVAVRDVVADVALLGSVVLLHLAILELNPARRVSPLPGWALITLQVLVDLLRLRGTCSEGKEFVVFGLLMAVQAMTSARTLWRISREQVHAPALYSSTVLLLFGLLNLGLSVATGTLDLSPAWHERLTLTGVISYLGVCLGLAFGFFWATTSQLTAEIERMAGTDPLTRVCNRRHFLQWCEKVVSQSQRSGVPFSVLMVDLDHFKRVNDTFGHQRGDEVLVAAVERMQDSIRGIDVLCRWGGEEFAVLLPNAPLAATSIVAERIRENIHRMNVPLCEEGLSEAEGLRLTVSIGAATYRNRNDQVSEMLDRADRALYRAKGTGRNRVLLEA